MKPYPRIKDEKLTPFRSMYQSAFGMDDDSHERASYFFGVPASECRAWYEHHPHPTAHRYLQVHHKGYLPYNNNWKECYIRDDGMVVTPWGNCSPSEMAFLHRNKWSAEQTRRQLVILREKLKQYEDGTKIKMLTYTAEYLLRQIKDLNIDT